jgi:phosphatidylinositol-3-phosphatase
MTSLWHPRTSLTIAGSLLFGLFACGSSGGGNQGGSAGGGGHGGSAGTSHGGANGAGGTSGGGGTSGTGGTSGSGGASGAGGAGGSAGTAGDGGSDSGGKTLFPAGTLCNKSGTPLTPPTTVEHVIVFMFENENLGTVIGNAKAPYMNSIATACAYSTAYDDNCFPTNLVSLPHYLALTSGSNCDTGLGTTGTTCITTDEDPVTTTLSTQSIFNQVTTWKAYQESMPSNCATAASGEYAAKHNPAAYYSALSTCSTYDVPIAAVTCNASTTMTACTTPSNVFTDDLAADTLPAYSFVTPNLLNDMHDGTVTQGDNWFYTYLPLVLQSKAYLNGQVAIFVLWDEQNTLVFGGPTPNFFVSPYITAGTASSTQVNHFASLLAAEKMLGITTYLGCASGTPPGGGTCPTGSTADLRSAINF